MKFEPHEYQRYAIDYIVDKPEAALFLDMGLGKTVITLTAIWKLCLDYFTVRKVLVIAPLRVARDTWPAELEKWGHLKGLTYSVAVGTEKERKAALERRANMYIINRENVEWLVSHCGDDFNFDMVVVDELSSFKNHKAQRFKALIKKRPGVKRFVGLTGTPCSNGLMDLWAQFRLLDMGKRLGKFLGRFRQTYFTPGRGNGLVTFDYDLRPGAEEQMYDAVKDITVSMKGRDYLKLPELVMNNVVINLDADYKDRPTSITKPMERYKKLKRDLILSLPDGEITASNAAVLSNKLLQFTSGAMYENKDNKISEVHCIHTGKRSRLVELVEEANGKPVLIAYWFKHELMRLLDRWIYYGAGIDSGNLTELIRELKTQKDFADWNAGKIKVGLIHPASAGHGLNLQAGGATLIWFTLPWSLELYQQTNARLYRQGQKSSTVVIHHLIAKDTIDERVLAALNDKNQTQTALIDAVKAELGAVC